MNQLTRHGRINARYRVLQLKNRYFIVDFASPYRIANYFIFSFLFKGNFDAWEVKRSDLKNIKYKNSNLSRICELKSQEKKMNLQVVL